MSELREAEDRHQRAARVLADALLSANEGGVTWARLTELTGFNSPATTRMRAQRAKNVSELNPSLRWRVEHGGAPRPSKPKPGLSISEAAQRLGVSRTTVYARIQRGELQSVTDDAGHPRVVLEED